MTRTADDADERRASRHRLLKRIGTGFCIVVWAGSLIYFGLDIRSFEADLNKATMSATARVTDTYAPFGRRAADDTVTLEWQADDRRRTAEIPVGDSYEYDIGDTVPISYAPSRDTRVFLENDDKYYTRDQDDALMVGFGVGIPLFYAAVAVWQSFKPSSRRRSAHEQRTYEKARDRRKAQRRARKANRPKD